MDVNRSSREDWLTREMTKRLYARVGDVAPAIGVATKKKKANKKKKQLYEAEKSPGGLQKKKSVNKFKIGQFCRVPLKQLPHKVVLAAGLKAALQRNESVRAKVRDVEKRSRVLKFCDERLGTLKVSARVLLESSNMEVESVESLSDSNSENPPSNSDSKADSDSDSASLSANPSDESEEEAGLASDAESMEDVQGVRQQVCVENVSMLRDCNDLLVEQGGIHWKFGTVERDCKGQHYTSKDISWTEIRDDERCMHGGAKASMLPGLVGNEIAAYDFERTEVDYFKYFWPMEFIDQIVHYTNQRIPTKQARTNAREIFKFLGLILIMREANPRVSRTKLWNKGSVYAPSLNLSQFGMPLSRFNMLAASISFVSLDTANQKIAERQRMIDEEDEDEEAVEGVNEEPELDNEERGYSEERPPVIPSLWAINELVSAFNERRSHFQPGAGLCVDESMIKWQGKDFRHSDGCPAVKKIMGKPEPVGLEMKAICCGTTGVMLKIQPSGNKYDKIEDRFSKYAHHTATTLRLAKDYGGSNRTIFGDSWFGSAECAVALRCELGLWSTMVVKQNHRNYPKQAFESLFEKMLQGKTANQSMRGQSKFATAKVYSHDENHREPVKLFATAWHDHSLLKFVGTCGTSLFGKPRQLKLWRNKADRSEPFTRTVMRPVNVEEYSAHANKVDMHNQLRQGVLSLERVFDTHRWELRTFVSLFGMTITDAYLAMSYFGSHRRRTPPFQDFITSIVEWLIRGADAPDAADEENYPEETEHPLCVQAPLRTHPLFAEEKTKLKRCCYREGGRGSSCGVRSTQYCMSCTGNNPETKADVVAICAKHWHSHQLRSLGIVTPQPNDG